MTANEQASRASRVCAVEDVARGTAARFEIDGAPIAVVRADDGVVYAVHDECSHAQVALSEGEVDGCAIECWLHGARFDLRTGEPAGPPATTPVPVYPVEIRDGDIYVNVTYA